ncbi:Protein CBG15040 [Caenorhabditis briggsae]|uniref:Protein CBG15040 n=1 Tax=Caenorhabditis briggsae TaxID=6238 RepID=A8XL94_CAEBR|nr:Protein CBG15040 [Caenorhabditis briggsae]CAP33419.2 Protein CBG15040 [Caenorhabditis briggsae]
MRIFVLLFTFLARFSDTCAPTRSATPIVCACATSEVALLYRIDGSEGGAEAIQPLGAVTQSDANNCPTTYSVTCPIMIYFLKINGLQRAYSRSSFKTVILSQRSSAKEMVILKVFYRKNLSPLSVFDISKSSIAQKNRNNLLFILYERIFNSSDKTFFIIKKQL